MADIVLPYTITPDTLADADEVQGNFDELALKAANKTGDTLTGTVVTRELHPVTDSAYDLGTTALRYRTIYVDEVIGAAAANNFGTVAVSGQSDVVADASGDTLTFVAGTGITLTTDAGADSVTITAAGTFQPGASGLTVGPTAVIYHSSTAVGNVGTGEDTLYSQTIPANTLNADKQSLVFEFVGTLAANNNTKTLKFKWGSTVVTAGGASVTLNSGTWKIAGRVVRTGATAQKVWIETTFITTTDSISGWRTYTTAAETLSSGVAAVVTGEATSTDDIKLEMANIRWEGSGA